VTIQVVQKGRLFFSGLEGVGSPKKNASSASLCLCILLVTFVSFPTSVVVAQQNKVKVQN